MVCSYHFPNPQLQCFLGRGLWFFVFFLILHKYLFWGKKGQDERRHRAVTIQLFTSLQYRFPPPPWGDLQGMTKHLHTTTRKIHLWMDGRVSKRVLGFYKILQGEYKQQKGVSQKTAIKSQTLWLKIRLHIQDIWLVGDEWTFHCRQACRDSTAMEKNLLDYSLSCTSREMSVTTWLSKPSVLKWRKRLNKRTCVFDPQVETAKLVARQNPLTLFASEQNFRGVLGS